MACDKRAYASKKSARQGIKNMHETIRVYWCDECHAYHTTQQRYGRVSSNTRGKSRGKNNVRHLG